MKDGNRDTAMTEKQVKDIVSAVSDVSYRLAGTSLDYREAGVGGGWTTTRRYWLRARFPHGEAVLRQGVTKNITSSRSFIMDFLRVLGWPVGDSAEETRLKIAAYGDQAARNAVATMIRESRAAEGEGA